MRSNKPKARTEAFVTFDSKTRLASRAYESISMEFEEKLLESLEHEGTYFESWVEHEMSLGEEHFMLEVFGDEKIRA